MPFQSLASDPKKPCCVCESAASGVHFGVFTCESCKLFFIRILKTRAAGRLVCINDVTKGGCDVSLGQRSACRFCRYKKCVQSGMHANNSFKGRNARTKAQNCSGLETTIEEGGSKTPAMMTSWESLYGGGSGGGVIMSQPPSRRGSSPYQLSEVSADLWRRRCSDPAVLSYPGQAARGAGLPHQLFPPPPPLIHPSSSLTNLRGSETAAAEGGGGAGSSKQPRLSLPNTDVHGRRAAADPSVFPSTTAARHVSAWPLFPPLPPMLHPSNSLTNLSFTGDVEAGGAAYASKQPRLSIPGHVSGMQGLLPPPPPPDVSAFRRLSLESFLYPWTASRWGSGLSWSSSRGGGGGSSDLDQTEHRGEPPCSLRRVSLDSGGTSQLSSRRSSSVSAPDEQESKINLESVVRNAALHSFMKLSTDTAGQDELGPPRMCDFSSAAVSLSGSRRASAGTDLMVSIMESSCERSRPTCTPTGNTTRPATCNDGGGGGTCEDGRDTCTSCMDSGATDGDNRNEGGSTTCTDESTTCTGYSATRNDDGATCNDDSATCNDDSATCIDDIAISKDGATRENSGSTRDDNGATCNAGNATCSASNVMEYPKTSTPMDEGNDSMSEDGLDDTPISIDDDSGEERARSPPVHMQVNDMNVTAADAEPRLRLLNVDHSDPTILAQFKFNQLPDDRTIQQISLHMKPEEKTRLVNWEQLFAVFETECQPQLETLFKESEVAAVPTVVGRGFRILSDYFTTRCFKSNLTLRPFLEAGAPSLDVGRIAFIGFMWSGMTTVYHHWAARQPAYPESMLETNNIKLNIIRWIKVLELTRLELICLLNFLVFKIVRLSFPSVLTIDVLREEDFVNTVVSKVLTLRGRSHLLANFNGLLQLHLDSLPAYLRLLDNAYPENSQPAAAPDHQ